MSLFLHRSGAVAGYAGAAPSGPTYADSLIPTTLAILDPSSDTVWRDFDRTTAQPNTLDVDGWMLWSADPASVDVACDTLAPGNWAQVGAGDWTIVVDVRDGAVDGNRTATISFTEHGGVGAQSTNINLGNAVLSGSLATDARGAIDLGSGVYRLWGHVSATGSATRKQLFLASNTNARADYFRPAMLPGHLSAAAIEGLS